MADKSNDGIQNVLLIAGGVFAALTALLWSGGAVAALIDGHAVGWHRPLAGLLVFDHPADPADAWHQPVGSRVVYWLVTGAVVLVAAVVVVVVVRVVLRLNGSSRSRTGMASSREVRRAAGHSVLLRKAAVLRPTLARAEPAQVGYLVGHAHGRPCWVSVEDSWVLVGPPRSGKGLHLVIPAILDAPGAVVTTSTRPDNLAATIEQRDRIGSVAVFDPQGLAAGVPGRVRWSLVRGCERPQVAMARARVLTGNPDGHLEDGAFWTEQCYTAVRCLLHAAALGERSPRDLLRWSLSTDATEDAADILRRHPGAAAEWHTALEAILGADPRQRDSVWAVVANAFSALSDPGVLAAVSPGPDEVFDPVRFLRERGTQYLLGTASGASATSSIVSAFVEDIVSTAQHLAAASPRSRLDPPLALILDEAANYPLPSLPSLMSEGGGTGITTMVVLQSLAQARAEWGVHRAAAIWDSAIVKLVLGGSGNADDLNGLVGLLGTRQERHTSESWGRNGRTVEVTSRDVPAMDAAELRMLPFGKALLLLRSAPPIVLELRPWPKRRDATQIDASRRSTEELMRRAAGGLP